MLASDREAVSAKYPFFPNIFFPLRKGLSKRWKEKRRGERRWLGMDKRGGKGIMAMRSDIDVYYSVLLAQNQNYHKEKSTFILLPFACFTTACHLLLFLPHLLC